MKKIFLTTAVLFIAVFALINFSACKRNTDNATVDATSVEDNSSAEKHFDLMYNEVDDASVSSGIGSRARKYTVTIDTSVSPRVMTLDYGDSNVLCDDFVYRRGKIVVTWTGRYKDIGTVITITPVNFYQNDNHIEGTKIVTNLGRKDNMNLTWKIEVAGKITDVSGATFTWNSLRYRTWIAGESTKLIRFDDKYQITGSYTGTNRKGVTFNVSILSPLLLELSCRYHITQGKIEIVDANNAARKIEVDFGNGTCDNVGTYTVNGVTKTFVKK